MGIQPCFTVTANDADITAVIASKYEYIKITDKVGYEADLCEISLSDDPANPIAMPEKGAELRIGMGYDGEVVDMGLFVVDEVEVEGPPDRMLIRARASIQVDSKKGMLSISSQKTRSWQAGKTIENVVSAVALEHGLTAQISDTLKAVVLPHFDQSDESDISFLLRLSKRYDAICKPAGGKLLFIKRGESDFTPIEINRYQCTRWRMVSSASNSVKSVIAHWYEKKKAKKHEVIIGSGEPVRKLRHQYQDEESARAGAQAEFNRSARGENTLEITKVGDPYLSAELPLIASLFRDGIDGKWIIDQVDHNIDKTVGFSSEIKAVKSLREEDSENDVE